MICQAPYLVRVEVDEVELARHGAGYRQQPLRVLLAVVGACTQCSGHWRGAGVFILVATGQFLYDVKARLEPTTLELQRFEGLKVTLFEADL